ncbi:hypothetical protein HID58_055736 [Brassica napus]|uniref:Protein kinase domain-containing protein n=1 Tax=Brassica napus TaxID=3708 RepID=A0ABQ8ALB6_BRANA|nr:hypothetical protein HID58_055736 [Brassica napus]
MKTKKKQTNSSIISVKEITKSSFEIALRKKPAAATITVEDNDNGGRINSSSWVKSLLLGRGAYGRFLIRLKSPFIVRCYGVEIAREEEDDQCMLYNLILEYCSGKTIADLIEDNHGELLESDVKVFARDVLSGLTYIHDRNIIHCDIKPDNLLLSPTHVRFRSTGYLTKIGDFGLAMEKGSVEYGNGYDRKRGTTSYMASKLMAHGIVDFGSDVWAFGYTVLEMLSGISVWGEYGDLDSDDWVSLIGHSDRMPHVPVWLSKDALDFLSRCLERDVNKRWSTHSLKNHPFVLL